MGLRLKRLGLMVWRHALSAGLVMLLPGLVAGALPMPWSEGLMESHNYVIIDPDGVPNGEILQELHGVTGRGGKQDLKAVYEIVRRTEEPNGETTEGKTTTEIVFDPKTYDLRSRLDVYSGNLSNVRVTFTPTPAGLEVRTDRPSSAESSAVDKQLIKFDIHGPLIDQTAFVFYIRGLPLEKGHTFSTTTINPARKGGVDWLKGMVLGLREVPWEGEQVEAWVIETATAVGVTTYHVLPDASHTLIRYMSPRGETYQLLPAGGD